MQTRRLEEFKICRRAPGISHLLFADDTLLFLKGEAEQANIVKEMINTYERCTGQLVSVSKCSIFFGAACSECSQRGKVLGASNTRRTDG